jgi:hypothetical protein
VLDLLERGGSGKVHADILSYAEYKFELCVVIRLMKDNKEEEEFVDVSPG